MRLAILTSGGDAQGMNAVVRAAIRRALALGHEPYVVLEGYAGLLAGELRPAGWTALSHRIQLGGTALGTARSGDFQSPRGRRRAVAHLVRADVRALLVVGGDGSLTGAEMLVEEWRAHLDALDLDGPVPRLVGVVGSIDRDLPCTDSTVGYDSALHRAVEAVDALVSTARSHQRAFVVEVMGRRCGALALATALCTDADCVLVPEQPEPDWADTVTRALAEGRSRGRRQGIVILAEGARDQTGPEQVGAVIAYRLGVETRRTVLGHVQRGGAPSAFDRIMGSALGVAAVDQLTSLDEGASVVLTTTGERIVPRPLGETLRAPRPQLEAERALFARMRKTAPASGRTLLLVQIGAPAPGMNAAVRTFVHAALAVGHRALAAEGGLLGLVEGRVRDLGLEDVAGIVSRGATVLGTKRWRPRDASDWARVEEELQRHAVDGLLVVGGYETLEVAETLGARRAVAVLPATVSNNVPGTDRSLGSDTALNTICEALDRLKQSSEGSGERVFFAELMGARCGYLATLAGIGAGAEIVYTHEDGLDLARIRADIAALNDDFDRGRNVALVLVADGVTDVWDTRSLARIFEAESGGRFDTRVCVLGHLQQGGRPSPRDRMLGTQLATAAVDWFSDGGSGGVVVGVRDGQVSLRAIAEVLEGADPQNRRPIAPSYSGLAEIGRALAMEGRSPA